MTSHKRGNEENIKERTPVGTKPPTFASLNALFSGGEYIVQEGEVYIDKDTVGNVVQDDSNIYGRSQFFYTINDNTIHAPHRDSKGQRTGT